MRKIFELFNDDSKIYNPMTFKTSVMEEGGLIFLNANTVVTNKIISALIKIN